MQGSKVYYQCWKVLSINALKKERIGWKSSILGLNRIYFQTLNK